MTRLSEAELLEAVLGERRAAEIVIRANGDWRDLSRFELGKLELSDAQRHAVPALQELVRRSYPPLPSTIIGSFEDLVRHYGARLGALRHEVLLALAVDGRNNLIEEVVVSQGGRHGTALLPADVLRPLIRCGASACILIHNHPSGDRNPSVEDLSMTRAVSTLAGMLGMPLIDHVIVGARGGGYSSMLELGIITDTENEHESIIQHRDE